MENSRSNKLSDIKNENNPKQINTLQINDNININQNESTFSKEKVEENIFDKIKTKKEDINNLTLQNLKNINPLNNINTLNTINKSNVLEKTYNVNISPLIETNINNSNYSNDNISNYLNNKYEYELNNNPINIINVNHLNFIYPTNKNQNYIKKENYLRSNNIINIENDNFDYSIKNNNIIKNTSEIPIINRSNKNIPFKKSQIDLIIYDINIIMNLLSNYKGSIFLQNALLMINDKELEILLKTILSNISKLMCMEYGNYFIQKLINKLNVQQRLNIYEAIENNFIYIAINKSGTHVIQALIDAIQTPLERIILDELLNKDLLLLFNNENSYHIIMKIILEIPENQRNNINLFVVANLEKIIINPYGAYCVSKFIINNTNLNIRLLLINNIQNNIKNLIFNKNSCSVLMLTIKKFGINNFEFIIKEIEKNLSFLSLHPVSNVFILKLFSYLNISKYNKLSLLIWTIFRNDNLIKTLLSHKNGNKIIKKIMEFSNNAQKKYIKAKMNLMQKI